MEGARVLRNQIITLNYLYHLQMFGEEFFSENILPQKEQAQAQNSQVLGWDPKGAKLGLITQTPTLDTHNTFLIQKSSQMLQDIMSKVFSLTQEQCGIFSLFKTQENIPPASEFFKYREILLAQISHSQAKVFVIFGVEEVGSVLFPNQRLQFGSTLNFRGKTLIFTHSLKALLRLEGLKKQTMQHLNSAKALM